MAKSTKTKTSDDQKEAPKTDVSEDVVEAEIIEEIDSTEDTSDGEETEAVTEIADDEDLKADSEEQSDEPPAPPVEQDAPATANSSAANRPSFIPLIIGGIIAGGIGFGAAQYLDATSSEPDPVLIELQTQISAQSDALDALKTQDQTLAQNVSDALGSNSQIAESLKELTASLSAVDQKFDDVSTALAGLDARIIELEKRPITQGLPSSALDAYEREIEDLRASVAAQRAEAQAMEENAQLTAQQALARAALTRVLSALDAGRPFRAALTDLSVATGNPAPAALETTADTGAPILASLQQNFPEFARKALATARSSEEATGANRLLTFMQQQLGARSVTPQEGDDADAILSRAEAAVLDGNLQGALDEISGLPEPAQLDMASWVERAQVRQSAIVAGEALAQSINSN